MKLHGNENNNNDDAIKNQEMELDQNVFTTSHNFVKR
jgi:hypothetical protein